MSADMLPYCSAHDEWLIMKLCMYDGYHTANNVSNFGRDPGDPIKFFKRLKNLITVLRAWRSIAVTRSQFLRLLLHDHAQTAVLSIEGHTSLSTALVFILFTYKWIFIIN